MIPELVSMNPTTRFSDRVENYVKYRPSYPTKIISFLEETIGLGKKHRIADIGSGTGLFSELFLIRGYEVIGIEPNESMRRASERRLSRYGGFTSRAHRAEQTGLRNHSVDLITVAQAFHWMEPFPTKKEFARILKPGGHIVLAWNIRLKNSPFMLAYHELKQEFAIEHQVVDQIHQENIQLFYEPAIVREQSFENQQMLDFDALKGQLLSSSYIPLPGHTRYEDMITQLAALFVAYNEKGLVRMNFETKVYFNG
jgi:SAM-dependent methyltransferase